MQRFRKAWRGPGVLALLLAALAGAGMGLGADDKPAKLPTDLARISPDAIFAVTFRVADIWNYEGLKPVRQKMAKETGELVKDLEKTLGAPPADIERATVVVPELQMRYGPPLFVATTRPYDKNQVLERIAPQARLERVNNLAIYVGDREHAVTFLDDSSYIVGHVETLKALLAQPVAKEGPLSAALQLAAGKHMVSGGFNTRPVLPLAAQLPAEADAFKPLLHAQATSGVFDLDTELKATLRATFGDADEAKAGEKAAKAGIEMIRSFLPIAIQEMSRQPEGQPVVAFLKDVDKTLGAAKLQNDGKELRLDVQMKIDAPVVTASVLSAVMKVRVAAGRMQSANNLKQLALAMHNYHDAYGAFPPNAIYGKDGKPLLSWRVAILPFIEQDNLYKEFHLDEPWDSAHNKKLLDHMPKTYFMPTQQAGQPPFTTRYLAFTGKGTIFEGTKGIKIQDITDGTSNTIMFVESAKGVPWTKPEDLPFDPKKPLPKLAGEAPGTFQAAFCDGSVRSMMQNMKEDLLKALITRNGGEVIPQN
jgi:hypothetical protein